MKQLIANRLPPGDRWVLVESESDIVYGSLTDCLNQIYVVHKATQFVVDANYGSAHSGGNKYGTADCNSLTKIGARSCSSKINTTIGVYAFN